MNPTLKKFIEKAPARSNNINKQSNENNAPQNKRLDPELVKFIEEQRQFQKAFDKAYASAYPNASSSYYIKPTSRR